VSEIKVPSGAEVTLSIASFEDAMALKDAVSTELSDIGIDLKGTIEKLSSKGKDFLQSETSEVLAEMSDPLIRSVMTLDASKDLRKCLFKCLERCKYNGEKITYATFEPESARGDYYSVMIECLKINLLPFFQNLASKLSTLQKITKPVQKSK
jgi:hypothetical protein